MRLTVDLLVAVNEQLKAPDEFFDKEGEQEVIAAVSRNPEALAVSREISDSRPERGFGFHGLM